MNVLAQIAIVTFGGILPPTSQLFSLIVAVNANQDIALINNAKHGDAGSNENIINTSKGWPAIRNVITISLVRDVLAIAAVVTLACLSILTPTVAIGIGAALLLSIVLSAVAIGQTVRVKNAADLWLATAAH